MNHPVTEDQVIYAGFVNATSITLLVRMLERMNHTVLQGQNSNVVSLDHIRLSLLFSLIETVRGQQVSSAQQEGGGERPHVMCYAHRIMNI